MNKGRILHQLRSPRLSGPGPWALPQTFSDSQAHHTLTSTGRLVPNLLAIGHRCCPSPHQASAAGPAPVLRGAHLGPHRLRGEKAHRRSGPSKASAPVQSAPDAVLRRPKKYPPKPNTGHKTGQYPFQVLACCKRFRVPFMYLLDLMLGRTFILHGHRTHRLNVRPPRT